MILWDDLTGRTAADASKSAAADTYAKQQAAIGQLQGYANTLPGQYNTLAGAYDPYRSAGGSALQRLLGGLGLGGDASGFTAAYHNLPGYQAGLDTAERAGLRAANATGMGASGRTLLALSRRASDYEDQRSGEYLQRLAGLAGSGMQATGAATGLQGQGLGAQSGLYGSAFGGQMNAAGTIGQGDVAAAQAQQQGMQNLLGTGAYLAGTFLGGPSAGTAAKGLAGFTGLSTAGSPYPRVGPFG